MCVYNKFCNSIPYIFLKSLADVARFCVSSNADQSPLLIDTTFNIAKYYFTQSAFQSLSLRHYNNSRKHPWFIGFLYPCLSYETVDKNSSIIGPPAGIEPTPLRCRSSALAT